MWQNVKACLKIFIIKNYNYLNDLELAEFSAYSGNFKMANIEIITFDFNFLELCHTNEN